jgi:hypothetical protein
MGSFFRVRQIPLETCDVREHRSVPHGGINPLPNGRAEPSPTKDTQAAPASSGGAEEFGPWRKPWDLHWEIADPGIQGLHQPRLWVCVCAPSVAIIALHRGGVSYSRPS